MPKKYLQEKITGSDGQYMAIQNGIPTGINAMFGVFPVIEVIAPSSTGNIVCSKDSVTLTATPVPIEGTSNSKWTFNPSSYGVWTVSAVQTVGDSNSYIFSDSIDVIEVRTYTMIITSNDFVSKVLENTSWELVKNVAKSMRGSSYWSIGDTKSVTLTGTSNISGLDSSSTLSAGSYNACIIGFNHNTQLEGSGLIHFQLYKSSNVNRAWSGFKFNNTDTIVGGWKNSYLRTTQLGTSLTQTNCLLSCFPQALKNVLSPVVKYTDNAGDNTSKISNITITLDYIFQPSVKEVFGDIEFSDMNQYEADYQQQYAYYTTSSNIIRYLDNNSIAPTYLRSVGLNSLNLQVFDSTASPRSEPDSNNTPRCISPCFCVGENNLLS